MECVINILFLLTIADPTLFGKVLAMMANDAVLSIEQPLASIERLTKHITTNTVPSGHLSRNLK